MLRKCLAIGAMVFAATAEVWSQTVPPAVMKAPSSGWRRPGEVAETGPAPGDVRAASAASTPAAAVSPPPATFKDGGATPSGPATGRNAVRVTEGTGTLPNEQGQVWREYDISPYTLRVTTTNRPEQAIVDWILRETGYEAWHGEPLGILSATRRTLRVYHTPQVQAVINDLVNRFVNSEAETHTFGLRVVTLDQPNWRARAQRLVKPVPVQTPGVNAWLLEREDAAVLVAELQRRSDYREHSSPHLLVNNGQSTVVSALRGQAYIRDVTLRPDVYPGFQADTGQIDEGFAIEFSPLLSSDRTLIDATIKCHVDQVEKLVPVVIDAPTATAPRQRAKIDVPQVTHFRFHERFRWPAHQVLLLSMGMVALPVPIDNKSLVPGLALPLVGGPPRADLLLLVESKGKIGQSPRVNRPPERDAKTYRGRY